MGYAAKRFFLAVFTLLGAGSRNLVTAHPRPDSCAVCRPTKSVLLDTDPGRLQIDPHSLVSDACTSFSTLDDLNRELQPSIRSLTNNTDFFSYYRLNLYNKECPFWSDEEGICGNIACSVNTIENEDDIPPIWRTEELSKLEGPKAGHPNRQAQNERKAKPLLGELGADVGESCVVEYDDECDERDYCVPEDEGATAKGDYVSLLDNPERFTGYSGPGARHVWEAIYRENCFSKPNGHLSVSSSQNPFGFPGSQNDALLGIQNVMREHEKQQLHSPDALASNLEDTLDLDDQCLEKRVFYRIISGMHTSISTHLCYDYLNKTTGQWGPNLRCYKERLQSHPERISNLYFNYALVLRALEKARAALSTYTFCSGDPTQDALTKHKVLGLVDQISQGPDIYDESLMFQDASVPGLKDEFKSRFRNISRAMDCVGCDKCRLWGKVQTNGYGTALKVLFEFDERDNNQNPPLRRTELVALINTLDKISQGLSRIDEFERMSIASSAEASEEDDGHESEHESDEKEPSVWDLTKEAFHEEFDEVWRVLKFVLRKYWEFPQTVYV